jgi:hypothetical protein
LVIAGLIVGALVAVAVLQGSVFSVRGPVDVPYPAGKVKELRVLGAVDVYVDGEPRPGPSVLGAIALLMLATAAFMTFAALRFAGAARRLRWFWAIAAAGLAVAGADELLAIHESIGHNLPFLADLPGVERPDDLLLVLYLPGAFAFAWWFRDVFWEQRLTVVCMAAAICCFGLSIASDLASLRIEEWFELVAGLFVAAGVVALMHRHLKQNLQIRVRTAGAAVRRPPVEEEAEPTREPALRR